MLVLNDYKRETHIRLWNKEKLIIIIISVVSLNLEHIFLQNTKGIFCNDKIFWSTEQLNNTLAYYAHFT